MPGSVSPRRHGVSRVLFGGDVAPAGSPTKPQSPRALTASLQTTYAPLPHSLSELKRRPEKPVGGMASSRSLDGSMRGGADAAISAARVVSRGVSPASGRRRTAVGRCNVPSYVVAALAEGASEVVFASSSLTDSNRRQPPKFNSSTAPLTDRDMGGCTLPQSSLIVDVRKGSPLRGSISPRRQPHDVASSSPRNTLNVTSSSVSSPRGVAARSGAVGGVEEALPIIGTGTHKIPFFPDSSHFKSSKRGVGRTDSLQNQDEYNTTASLSSPSRGLMTTGDHPANESRSGISHVQGSPGRLIGSVPPQCPSPSLPRAITSVPTRSGTNPIYPLEMTKLLVQADSNSAMHVSESARMFKPSLDGYTSMEAGTRDASIRRKWASGDRRATVEAGLLHRKQQEVTTKELNEQRRIDMKRYQKEFYEDRLLEYQKWEAKKLRLGHKL